METHRKVILASIFAASSVIAVFLVLFLLTTEDSRLPASSDGEASDSEAQTQVLNAIQIKTEMIQSIEWKERSSKMVFEIHSQDRDFCLKWQNLKLILVADGVAVSGESPSGEMSAVCENNQFEIDWPKRRSEWDRQVVMRGDFTVDPLYFYIGRIEISGALGEMKISNAELLSIRGQSFDLEVDN